MQKEQLEEVASFIREHRSNESNFEKLYAKFLEETKKEDTSYTSLLKEISEKYATEYHTAKEHSGTAWPEFEKFVSEFEKAVLEASKK